MASKIMIDLPGILIVEGKDEELFLSELLKFLQLNIQILPVGGKNQLKANLRLLTQTPNFEIIARIGIIRDADNDPEGAFASVRSALKTAELPVPEGPVTFTSTTPQVGIFIMPPGNLGTNHMLEDLCLEVVKDDPALKCVDEYFKCLTDQGIQIRPNVMAKARLHAFLASREKPDLRLGEAARAGYWDWKHPAFDTIKRFLQDIAASA